MNNEILHRFFDGKCNFEEEAMLLEWVNQEKEHLDQFMKQRRIWDSLLVNGCIQDDETYKANYSKLKHSINRKSVAPVKEEYKTQRTKKYQLFRNLAKYAAIFLFGVAVYAIIDSIFSFNKPLTWNEIEIPKGNRVKLKLPDNSTVWLNSQTKFKYPEYFGNNQREVWLDGEAFFEVAKDSRRRFVVHTSKLNVVAVGTSFNVLAYKRENVFETALVTGKVKIENNVTGKIIANLIPNQLAFQNSSNQTLAIKVIDTEPLTAWKNGEFKFKNERIEDIALKLERYYNLKIVFNSSDVKDIRLTGTFPVSESWEKILVVFEKYTGIPFKRVNNTIFLDNKVKNKTQ